MANCNTLTGQHIYRMPPRWPYVVDAAAGAIERALDSGCSICGHKPDADERAVLHEQALRHIDAVAGAPAV